MTLDISSIPTLAQPQRERIPLARCNAGRRRQRSIPLRVFAPRFALRRESAKQSDTVIMRSTSLLNRLCTVLLSVVDQTCPTIPQQQFLPIGFCLCQQREQHVSHLRCNALFSKHFQGLRKIQHFRNRGWFLQAPTAQGLGESCHPLVKLSTLIWCAHAKNLGFPLRSGMVYPKIEAASSQGVADSALFVGSQNDERNSLSPDQAELRNA